MPPYLALFSGSVFVCYAFHSDRKRKPKLSRELAWPTLWYLVVATRPFGVWLAMWGVPIPGGSGDPTEGSILDRFFFGGLTLIGIWILAKRRFDATAVFRCNPWLAALLAFMALSMVWSSYPFVSLKRYIKILGSVVMAFVILTEANPLQAFHTVIRRCLYVHLPMSIICVKYFREIGVSFSWEGSSSAWQGISTSKNTLGQIAMLGVVYFFWEVWRRWREVRWRNLHLLYLGMALWLLKGSGDSISLTSLSVSVFALVVFIGLQLLHNNGRVLRPFVNSVFAGIAALITLVLIHSVVHFQADGFFGQLITAFGRDITLTDRTNIWNDVYAAASGNPLLGVGFGGFWIGRLANIPWNENMTWVLGQAHSGYVDTYLQLGLIGAFLLANVIFSTLPKLFHSLADNFEFGCFRITLFLTILFVNITESTFLRGDHHLWLLTMVVLWNVPRKAV
jgi:O-antigen ligase